VSRLSSFTHITPKKFDLSTNEADKLATEATDVFEKLFRLIEERRDETRKAAESEAQDALQDVLYGEVNEELDRLSTHSSVTGVDLYGLKIVSMDPQKSLGHIP
jgi:hypothetical protein